MGSGDYHLHSCHGYLLASRADWLHHCAGFSFQANDFISDEFEWLIVFWLFSQREPSQDVPALVTRPSVAPSPVRSKTRGVSHQSGHSSDRSTGATQTHTGGATAGTVSGTYMGLILNYAWGIGPHRWHSVHQIISTSNITNWSMIAYNMLHVKFSCVLRIKDWHKTRLDLQCWERWWHK